MIGTERIDPVVGPESFVDATVVAQFLSVTRRHVLDLRRRGLIPAHPVPGDSTKRRVWRFLLSEVALAVKAGNPAIANGSPLAPKRRNHGAQRLAIARPRGFEPRTHTTQSSRSSTDTGHGLNGVAKRKGSRKSN